MSEINLDRFDAWLERQSEQSKLGTTRVRRIDKRAFEKAYKNGERVIVVKDPDYMSEFDEIGQEYDYPNRPSGIGFTKDTVRLEDVYRDGPSRPRERWRFWVTVTPAA